MKKLLTFATAALLFTGAFAHDGKDCSKEKSCCKKDGAKKECCKKESKSADAKAVKASKASTKKA